MNINDYPNSQNELKNYEDTWALIDKTPRKPWIIQLYTSSENCPHRYRKWKPGRKGFSCKLLKGAKCANETCKLKARD